MVDMQWAGPWCIGWDLYSTGWWLRSMVTYQEMYGFLVSDVQLLTFQNAEILYFQWKCMTGMKPNGWILILAIAGTTKLNSCHTHTHTQNQN